jgi:hypothetical protein
VRLPPEADHAVAAAATLHVDLGPIEEHAAKLGPRPSPRDPAGAG